MITKTRLYIARIRVHTFTYAIDIDNEHIAVGPEELRVLEDKVNIADDISSIADLIDGNILELFTLDIDYGDGNHGDLVWGEYGEADVDNIEDASDDRFAARLFAHTPISTTLIKPILKFKPILQSITNSKHLLPITMSKNKLWYTSAIPREQISNAQNMLNMLYGLRDIHKANALYLNAAKVYNKYIDGMDYKYHISMYFPEITRVELFVKYIDNIKKIKGNQYILSHVPTSWLNNTMRLFRMATCHDIISFVSAHFSEFMSKCCKAIDEYVTYIDEITPEMIYSGDALPIVAVIREFEATYRK